MTMGTNDQRGAAGAAVARAADAMLRSLGGVQVVLVLPLNAMPGDVAGGLGMVDPGVEELGLSPVVIRTLAAESTGPRRRLEFLIPASALATPLKTRNVGSGQALLDGALGLMHEGELFHIQGVATEYYGGNAYLYRVTAVE